MATVVIAGATGFIGQQLALRLKDEHRVIGLTRASWRASQRYPDLGVEWRDCDLYSLRDAEDAVEGADYAVYLVHSMAPSARLTQANFADLDLILADNFGRACRTMNVQQIVYLGGIVSELGNLSPHLRSRIEVEDALCGHGVPLTAVRAGLVMGAGGSSFNIMKTLVERLPVLALPSWTRTPMSPVSDEDAVELLARCVGAPETFGVTSDIGHPSSMTYEELLRATAEALGLNRRFVRVPLLSPEFSRMWVRLITGAPNELVAPLVSSLNCPMEATNLILQEMLSVRPVVPREALRNAVERTPDPRVIGKPASEVSPPPQLQRVVTTPGKEVRSVQRLRITPEMSAEWIAREYQAWLPHAMRPFVRVRELNRDRIGFFFLWFDRPLLELSFAPDRSNRSRSLFYITGGVLADTTRNLRGRLEFRTVSYGTWALAAIHEFIPSLPWAVYRWTQAAAHGVVMASFRRHLRLISEGRREPVLTARTPDFSTGTLQTTPRDDGFSDGPMRLRTGEFIAVRQPRATGEHPASEGE